MEGVLKFSLPEDNDEFKLAQRGAEYYSFLFDLDQELRGFLKYGHNFKSIDEAIQYIRDRINEVKIYDIK